jgi:List-Bact-rpt repeat protein
MIPFRSMQHQRSMPENPASEPLALRPSARRLRTASRWALPGTLFLVVLMVASSSATAASLSGASANAPSLHLAAPVATALVHAHAAGHAASPRVPTHLPHQSPSAAAAPATARPGYVESGKATFFNNTPIPNPTNNTCIPYGFSLPYVLCYNTTTEPSLNLTTTGYTGLAYTAFTNVTACPGMANYTYTQVGFVVSTNFGSTWSTPKYLGNSICSGYPDQNYSSSFEPSLTSLPNGTFVLTYIQYNSSDAYYGFYGAPPSAFSCGTYSGNLLGSRVVVTESYNDGLTWTTPTVINGTQYNSTTSPCPLNGYPDIRPQITAFGDTVYLTWTYVSNPLFYNYASTFSAGVQFTYSTNGGSTWAAITSLSVIPSTIYGYYSSVYATDPSIMVSPSGELYLAYSTNYSTSDFCGSSGCGTYPSASIEVATSMSNGTSFNYSTADSTVFVSYPNFYPYTYWDPFTTMAYSSVNDQAYIAFSAAAISEFCEQEGVYGTYCGQDQVDKIFFQNSSDNGTTWSATSNPSPYNQTLDWYSPAYNPSFAVGVNGQIDLQYVEENDAFCENITVPYITYYCAPVQDNYVTSDDNGSTWSPPTIVAGTYTYTYGPYREIWDGFTSSTIAAGGQVLLGWTQVSCVNITLYGCDLPDFVTAPTLPVPSAEVMTSRLYEGTGLTLTFNESGLPAGTSWSVNIQGNLRDGPAGTNLTISGVPPSSPITWTAPDVSYGYGTQYTPASSITPPSGFTKASTIDINYTQQILVNILTIPNALYADFWIYPYYGNVQITPAPGPTWVTAGTSLTYTVSYISPLYAYCYNCLNLTFLSWGGTGSGSVSTNSTTITFTPLGPVNETATFSENGYCWGSFYITYYSLKSPCLNFTYALNFLEQGLPAGTNWGVTLVDPNGTANSETSTTTQMGFLVPSGLLGFTAWTIPDGTNGMYWVPTSNPTSPLSLPTPSSVVVTYTAETLTSTEFATTFEESGLPNGTAWSVDVGGQSYGVKSANGTVSINGGSAPSVNGSAVYLQSGDGYYVSSIEVTPFVMNETTYSVVPGGSFWVNGSSLVVLQYSPMYRLTVTGSVGGSVSPASQWIPFDHSVTLGESASSGFHFVGWSGIGPGSVTTGTTNPTVTVSGVVSEFATFRPNAPATWNLTLTPLGLPAGTAFAVSLGGTIYSGTGSFKIGNLTQGSYAVAVPLAYLNSTQTTRFVPTTISSSLPYSGGLLDLTGNGTVSIAYSAQYVLSIASTPGGTVTWGTSGTTGISWFNASEQVSLVATPDPHYYFVSWNGTGNGSVTATTASISLLVLGPATETAQFQYRPTSPPATYSLAVTQSGLPTGTSWSVAVGGLGASGSAVTLTVVGLNGSYLLTAPTIYTTPGVRWVSNTVNVTDAVTANGTFSVAYSEQFEVTVLGATGGTVTPLGSQWVAPGSIVTLAAAANSTSLFLSWNGTGTGNYTGTEATTTLTVTGPITEQVAFGPQTIAQKTSSSSSTNGQLMALGLLVVLLVVGLVVGLLVGRRRAPPSGAEAEPGPASDAEMGSAPAADAPLDQSDDTGAPSMGDYDEGPASN